MKAIRKVFWKYLLKIKNKNVKHFIFRLILRIFSSKNVEINLDSCFVKDEFRTFSFLVPSRFLLYIDGLDHRLSTLLQDYCLSASELNSASVIIDVGANIGELSLGINKNTSVYIGFEPSPMEFAVLKKNVCELQHGICFNLALGSTTGQADFYIKSDTADSSVLEITDYSEIVSVMVTRLDDVPEIKKIDEIDIIKLEAEGYEPEILLGAPRTLQKTRLVTVDCGFERGIHKESTLCEVVNILCKAGFELINFNPKRHTYIFKNANIISVK